MKNTMQSTSRLFAVVSSRYASRLGSSATQRMPIHRMGSSLFRSIFVKASLPLLEAKVINVPTMGDSITEGTIVEWTAQVGQAVQEEDVIALIETDKVTVDIKAEMSGVITEQFGQVDDTVEVGAPLYTIDTEAEATVEGSAPAATPSEAPEEPAPSIAAATEPVVAAKSAPPTPDATVQSTSSTATKHRTPSIRFLGKQGWRDLLSGKPPQPASPTETATMTVNIHPMYGRPPFTAKEMDALIFGGANLLEK